MHIGLTLHYTDCKVLVHGIEGFGASEIAASVCMHLQYTEQLQIDPYCSNVDSTIHCICDGRQHISQCGGKVLLSK